MGRAYSPPSSKLGLLLRCGGLLAGVWLLYAALGHGSWAGSGGALQDAPDEGISYGGWGFASVASTGGNRRQLHPHEMCSWETAVDSTTFDRVVEKEGWPTKFEQLVAESQPIAPVFCPVCGAAQQTLTFPGMNVREEGRCPRCSSFNRLRQLADAALPEVWRMTGRNFRSLNEVALSELAIYHTQCAGVLHNILSAAAGYTCSEFVSAELAPGTVTRNIRHEDLQRTSFPDNTFDLIICTEVLSRVASPYQALHEMKRILKPGGSHIFTVPISPSDYHDDIRASVEDGHLVHHVDTPLYTADRLHPKGVLLFTIFGRELVDKLCMLGFNVTAQHMHHGAHGIIGNNAWVFITTKT